MENGEVKQIRLRICDTGCYITTPPKIQELTANEQRDEPIWPDSQNTIPNELLPGMNVYSSKRITVHPSDNHELKTPVQKLRIRRSSKFKESPYMIKFGSTVGGQEVYLNEYINGFRTHAAMPWNTVEDIYILVNIKEKQHWVLGVLSFSERCIFLYDSYESSGHYLAVLTEIEKLAEIIPLFFQDCDFYDKKGIDL
ncbi:hypothetical protein CQW23_02997 [Capsicum baccatum]|uniref:Ubiquitin-like protease family profile domain-containing protein n=1 Tax=Capsicum baccatum TaxID=33114 RepID=A0A2G2XT09_CAPBA|nr:hypothetical protein CQW23_02997 [Capsicum baccatum]